MPEELQPRVFKKAREFAEDQVGFSKSAKTELTILVEKDHIKAVHKTSDGEGWATKEHRWYNEPRARGAVG